MMLGITDIASNPALINTLMMHLRTDSMILNFIINTSIMGGILWCTEKLPKIIEKIKLFFKKKYNVSTISFTATQETGKELVCSESFKAWMDYYRKQLNEKLYSDNPFNIKELNIRSNWWSDYDEGINIMVPDGDKIFPINEFIECDYTEVITGGGAAKEFTNYKLTISLINKKNSSKLIEFSNKLIEDYREVKKMKYNSKPYIFEFQGEDTGDDKSLKWIERPFESFRTIDHIWFDDKDKFINRYNEFMHGRELSFKRGDPWTFSCMLYGSPGCGKSSLLKSLLNIDKANGKVSHLIVIPFGYIKKSSTLSRLMLDEEINDSYIPFSQRIYVFEDFDAFESSKILMTRDELSKLSIREKMLREKYKKQYEKKDDDDDDDDDDDTKDIKFKKSSLMEMYNFMDDKLSLSGVLNILDGLIERNGQRIFWTTNSDITRFDPAFMRPGRMDLLVKFTKCTKEGIKYLIELYYAVSTPIEPKITIKDYKISPAELKELCRLAPTIEHCIKLINSFKK